MTQRSTATLSNVGWWRLFALRLSRRSGTLAAVSFLALACSGSLESEADEVPSHSAGSERMARRIAALADTARPLRNPFLNRARVALLERQALPAGEPARTLAELERAVELLRAGESEQAVERLTDLVALVEREGGSFGPRLERSLRSQLAIAYLRLGEQENCLEHHRSDSCLIPIQEGGVHRIERGSRAALSELAVLLREEPDSLEDRWLYNLAAMTLGEYPDGVPEAWRVPPEVFDSEFDIGRFVDVAPEVGLATVGLAGGSVVDDLDGDGLLDVMVSSWGLRDPLRYFHSRGAGTFEERTEAAGLAGLTGGLNLVQADYDNDGDLDVLVLRGAWLHHQGRHPNSLLRNRGDGRFDDVTEEVGLLSFHPTQTASWGDYDNDGWLDLFIGNESSPGEPHPCELYRNLGADEEGRVRFADVAAETGLAERAYVKGAVWGDVDNDGWLDLYLSRLDGPNRLFHNRPQKGGRIFVEIAAEAGVEEPMSSFPTFIFDYDNDGWLDLFVSAYAQSYLEPRASRVVADYLGFEPEGGTPRLYRNAGSSAGRIAFIDATADARLERVLLAMGANFGDLDSDGWLDLYLGTGAPDFRALVPNRMFRNHRGLAFQDVTTAGGVGHLQKGHGVSFADLDNDGDQDVLAVMGGAFEGDLYPNALFLNPGHGNRFLTLRLEGTRSNRSAIGARIAVEIMTPAGRRRVFSTVGSGGSFGASSLQQEIGLGDAERIERVEVRWPGGETESFTGLPLDRIVRLREGDPSFQLVELERLVIPPGSAASGSPPH